MNKKVAYVCVLYGDLRNYRQKMYMPEKLEVVLAVQDFNHGPVLCETI